MAVLGLGMEGESLCEFFLKKKARITVFDQKTAPELSKTYEKFKKLGVKFKLGKDYLKNGLKDFNLVLRSPGFKRFLPQITAAEKKGAIISSATNFFFDLCPAKIIGVTGTKGKGTTATLIAEILKRAKKRVFLAGNIGQPMLALLPKLAKDSWVVLELSSFQLQDMDKGPHIAVVLFITSEHLDYHRDTEEYVEAKSNIVRFQKENDFCVLNADDKTSSSLADLTKAKTFYFSRQKEVRGSYIKDKEIFVIDRSIGKVNQLQILGTHNWDNVCAAATATWLAGADINSIKRAIFSFTGLEHRLEFVKKVKEVSFYNDSFSTTPETAIAAIQSFKEPVILIAGGSEKGSDYTDLGYEIAKSSVKTLIAIGQMAGRIEKAALRAGFKGEIIDGPKKMKEIVNVALKESDSGDVVLLSPACASFDMFENYKDRGDQFKKGVSFKKDTP